MSPLTEDLAQLHSVASLQPFLSLKTLTPGFLFVECFIVLRSREDTVPTLFVLVLIIVPFGSLLALG